MKWAVFFLCLLGIMAAACAAFLVNGMRLPDIQQRVAAVKSVEDKTEVQVLFATRAIPAMTVVDSRLVVAKSMMKSQAPKGFISNTVEVVGKVIARPLVEGQPFTADCFAGDSASRIVAEAIPKGKRAVGISVTDYAGMEGMLYPGSTVDVMASFKAQGSTDWRESSTNTLLENVQVLGIEQQTVVSPGKTLNESATVARTRRVTLLVDTKQAKVLQLAMEHGTLSLALRNPMDDSQADRSSVSVGKLMGGNPSMPVKSEMSEIWERFSKAAAIARANQEKNAALAPAPATQPSAPPPPPQWEVTIIRGDNASTQNFPMPTTKPASDVARDATKVEPDAAKVEPGSSLIPMSMSR
jgi:pilus assembly protein CpaB